MFSEGLNETFLALAQIIETVYQYSAKWDQPKNECQTCLKNVLEENTGDEQKLRLFFVQLFVEKTKEHKSFLIISIERRKKETKHSFGKETTTWQWLKPEGTKNVSSARTAIFCTQHSTFPECHNSSENQNKKLIVLGHVYFVANSYAVCDNISY